MANFELEPQPISLDGNKAFADIANFKELTAGGGASQFKISPQGFKVGDTTIIDSAGLNSLNNFTEAHITDVPAFETASTSFVSVTGGAFSTLTLSRNAHVLLYLNILGRNKNIIDSASTLTYYCQARIYCTTHSTQLAIVDFTGSCSSYFTFGTPNTFDAHVQDINISKVIVDGDFQSGSHTMELQLRAVNGGTARLSDSDIGYLILGI